MKLITKAHAEIIITDVIMSKLLLSSIDCKF